MSFTYVKIRMAESPHGRRVAACRAGYCVHEHADTSHAGIVTLA